MIGEDVDVNKAALCVDDHVDLRLVHRDRDSADGVGVVAQRLEALFNGAGRLTRAGEVLSADLIMKMDVAHTAVPPESPPS